MHVKGIINKFTKCYANSNIFPLSVFDCDIQSPGSVPFFWFGFGSVPSKNSWFGFGPFQILRVRVRPMFRLQSSGSNNSTSSLLHQQTFLAFYILSISYITKTINYHFHEDPKPVSGHPEKSSWINGVRRKKFRGVQGYGRPSRGAEPRRPENFRKFAQNSLRKLKKCSIFAYFAKKFFKIPRKRLACLDENTIGSGNVQNNFKLLD